MHEVRHSLLQSAAWLTFADVICPVVCMCMQAFESAYQREFGFVLEERKIIVDDVRIRATGRVRT